MKKSNRMKHLSKVLALSTLAMTLSACNGFFDVDNTPTPTPLTKFHAEIKPKLVWSSHPNFGVDSDYIKLVPALSSQHIFTAARNGTVSATDKVNGRTTWSVLTGEKLSAGLATDEGLVFVGSRQGKIIALSELNGKKVWETQLSSEILAPPVAKNNYVLVKTIDGQLSAIDEQDGHVLWHYQQTEPALILRGGSAPAIYQNTALAGFANGNLAKLSLKEGSLLWQATIATPEGSFAIQRMVDIDSNPVIFHNKVYAATYQGRVAALDFETSKQLWASDISSFTGLSVDNDRAYVSDATSHVWAFDSENGTVDWRQSQLEARNITGPAMMGDYIVVGDTQGYLHWLSKQDGHFVGRTRAAHFGILATPVVENNILYVVSRDGYLSAYKIG